MAAWPGPSFRHGAIPRPPWRRGLTPEPDVILRFGTDVDNFGLIQLRWLTRDRPRVRVTLQLWDVGGQRVARSQVGSGDCAVELDLE